MAHILMTGLATVDFVFRLDRFPTEPIKYRANDAGIVGGGCAANASVAVARLGGKASLVTRLGDDVIGDIIVADLEADGVETGLSRRTPGARSSYSSNIVDAAGERQIVNFRGEGLLDDVTMLDAAPVADAYLVDSRWDAGARHALKLARKYGKPGVLDAEPLVDADSVRAASHVAFSREGLQDHTGEDGLAEGLKAARVTTRAWVCVTDGSAGVHYLDGDEMRRVPAFEVDVVDTLGAGDVWHGAFALALGEGADNLAAMRFANAAAALKCTQFGGRKGTPQRDQLETFLRDTEPCN